MTARNNAVAGKISIYIRYKSVFNRRKRQIRETAAMLAGLFGGATVTPPSDGFWVHSVIGLMRERVVQVYSFANDDMLDMAEADVIEWCRSLKKRLGEESILLEINNVAHFI